MNTKPFIIGITGHRDLADSQYYENLLILKGHLLKRQREYESLLILTPLAEGADRIIAKVAIELQIHYEVILPMPKKNYINDFSKDSIKEFEHYLEHAEKVTTLPLYKNVTLELIEDNPEYRSLQYQYMGKTLVDKSDEMIIMSDGKDNKKKGGTADIANYAKRCDKILYTIRCNRQLE